MPCLATNSRWAGQLVPDTSAHPLRGAIDKFWVPIPWMLEAAIVLQCGQRRHLR